MGWPSRCLALALALAALAVAGAAVPGAAASAQQEEGTGGIGLRLLDAPVAAQDDPRARVYIVDHLAPGSTIERRIEVSNTTSSPWHVELYAAAATITDGAFVGEEGHAANEVSTWTSVTPASPDVAAGGRHTATVTIAVPADAAPGEQYGVVWAEARSAAVADGGVVQVSRVGIRLYISVGAGGAPAANFSIDSLSAGRTDDGQPVISATVRNTGGRALDMTGALVLSDGPGALTAGPFPAELGSTLAIGHTADILVGLDGRLPAGPWRAVITLKSGLTERSAEATVTFPDSGMAARSPAEDPSEPARPGLLPVGVALVVVTVGLGAALGVRHHRRRGAGRPWRGTPPTKRPAASV